MLDVRRVIVTWQLQVVPEHLRATLPYPEELDSTQTSRVCRLGLFDHVAVTVDETYFCGSLRAAQRNQEQLLKVHRIVQNSLDVPPKAILNRPT